jgi:hypothetical protein
MQRPRALVAVSLALAACSGGSDRPPAPTPIPPPTVLVGTFTGGPVQGLRYRTASQSGFTDAMGRFDYGPGESVEFFVGGIRLGSAAGAASVNLFSLFAMTPPATEAALRAELATRNNVTNFDRVANIARFLVSLDNDHDPGNGLDVTGWDTRLAAASLSFDAPMFAFASSFDDPRHAFSRFARRHGINGSVPFEMPLARLYRSLGIAVAVQAQVRESVDENNDGVADAIETATLDVRGRQSMFGDDTDADGINNSVIRERYRADGRQESFTYEEDIDEDGIADQRFVGLSTYDVAGNRLSFVFEDDADADGTVEQRRATLSTFDPVGRILTETFEEDVDADGNIDSRESQVFAYDAANNPIRVVSETDSDSDGSVNSRTTVANTHDIEGRRLTTTTESDFNADGTVEFRRSISLTYDSAGNLMTRIDEQDTDNDGVIDSRGTESFSYDAVGNNLSAVDERDSDGDGAADSRQAVSSSYDASGNVLTRIVDADSDADNVFESRETTTFAYDAIGNVLTRVRVDDRANPAAADLRLVLSNEYGPSGALQRATATTDFENDGVVDSTSVTTHSHARIDDGIEYLLLSFRNID